MKIKDMNLGGHASMLGACAMWGLMAPVAKSSMTYGLNAFTLITFRVVGAALCFWIASFFCKKKERVSDRDLFLFFFAALSAIVFSQCQFTIGLSYTSPIDASIITTMVPIFTLVLAAIFLHEPVTNKKVLGIFCGAIGALLLITGSGASLSNERSGWFGDTLVLIAQFSFAVYLTLFKHLISRYSVITCMKWMFTYASITVIPFTYHQFYSLDMAALPLCVWGEVFYIVVGGTFVAYILMVYGQKRLRPTIVSMYNYTQPIVACGVSVATGMGAFGITQALAVFLVFGGVYLVTQSKSRADVLRARQLKERQNEDESSN